jgi:hypothetical protein
MDGRMQTSRELAIVDKLQGLVRAECNRSSHFIELSAISGEISPCLMDALAFAELMKRINFKAFSPLQQTLPGNSSSLLTVPQSKCT